MPINANAFNSRVTSEALEKRFRETFPAQGGAELIQDLYASGVIIPVVDFTATAEGSFLREDLQSAWDFSTGTVHATNATQTVVNTSGFWKLSIQVNSENQAGNSIAEIAITNGITSKPIWKIDYDQVSANIPMFFSVERIVFLEPAQAITATASNFGDVIVNYRQIADLYGNFTNPLGFVSQ
jgi:hypothetical protein